MVTESGPLPEGTLIVESLMVRKVNGERTGAYKLLMEDMGMPDVSQLQAGNGKEASA